MSTTTQAGPVLALPAAIRMGARALAVVVLAVALLKGGTALAGLVFVGAAAVVFFLRPTWAVWLVLGLIFFGNRVEIPALIFWGRYLPTLGILAFVAAVAARRFAQGTWRWSPHAVVLACAGFAGLLVVSALYNDSELEDVVLSLGVNLRYPLFFLALINARLTPEFYRRVLVAFVALTLLQLPVSIAQFAAGIKGDFLAGTMGSNQALISAVLVSQVALTARWLATGRHGLRYLGAVIALLIPGILADVQVGLAFFPILGVFVIVRHFGGRRLLQGLAVATAVVAGAAALVVTLVALVPEVRQFLSVLPQYELRWFDPEFAGGASLGRITILVLALPFLLEAPLRLVWGFGPESASGGLLTATYTDIATAEKTEIGVVSQRLADIGATSREPQIFRGLMEHGIVGTALYFLPLLLLWRRNARLLPHVEQSEERWMLLTFEGVSLLFIVLGIWYLGIWRLDSYCFPFWLLAAAMAAEEWRIVGRQRERRALRPEPVRS